MDNALALRDRGIYEACAWTGAKYPRQCSPSVIDFLIGLADPEKLAAAGDTLPAGETFTLYRGVQGRGRARQVRGPSWTSILDVACWFAVWDLMGTAEDPAVFKATVNRRDVLFYYGERGEGEFFCRRPSSAKRMGLTVRDIREGAERHNKLKAKSYREWRKALESS